MSKDDEKKFSGEMSDDELENVAGGWCSKSDLFCWKWDKLTKCKAPKLDKNQKVYGSSDGGYRIETDYGGGSYKTEYFDEYGNSLGGAGGKML